MTHLLGSKNCIDSLCKDIANMQETFDAIEKKSGRLGFSSWKFPSKKATELNIEELLDDYSYCKDEESNRLSHLILFELVIDRFCALLQGIIQLFDNVFVLKSDSSRPMSRTVTSTMSIGLITKMFWNKMSQVQYSYQNMEKELSDFNQSLMSIESSYLELKLENDKLKKKSSKAKKPQNNERIHEERESCVKIPENKDFSSTSTQTYETAFVPCDACAQMQSNLMHVGSKIITICESQELPSSLSKHNKLLKDIQMTAPDAIRWGNEQEKDLQKINKHMSSLCCQIDSLKTQLEKSKSACNTMKSQGENLLEKNQQLQVVKQSLETENQKLVVLSETQKTNVEELKAEFKASEMKNIELKNEKEHLSELLTENQKDLEKYQGNISALEQDIKNLSSQLHQKIEENAQLLEDQRKQDPVMEQLKENRQKLQESEQQLKKITAENKVLLKHDQGLQTKQASLLTKLENLTETCDDLRSQLEDANDENEKLRSSRKSVDEEREKLSKERDTFKNELDILKSSPHTADSSSEIARLSHQLKLVVSYPVIGSDYKKVEDDYTMLVSDVTHTMERCSEVTKDMELQLQANDERIRILQQQNRSLKNSLMKLDEAKSHSGYHNGSIDQLDEISFKTGNHIPSNRHSESNSTILPKPPNEPRSASKLTRPWSGNKNKKESLNIGAKLANLERLKNSQPINIEWDSKNMPKTAWDDQDSIRSNEHSAATIHCPGCDRAYLSIHDLDIHKAFCFGKI